MHILKVKPITVQCNYCIFISIMKNTSRCKVIHTEFLKGHLCFLPFTFYSINALLFTTYNLLFLPYTTPIYHLGFTIYHFQSTYFLPFTTFNLLFLFTILVLQFTISNLLLLVPFTVFVLLFITSKSTCTFI